MGETKTRRRSAFVHMGRKRLHRPLDKVMAWNKHRTRMASPLARRELRAYGIKGNRIGMA